MITSIVFLVGLLLAGCGARTAADDVDATPSYDDAGSIDARTRPTDDAGIAPPRDAGSPLDAAGPVDAGPVDAGPVDAGPVDTGPVDAATTFPCGVDERCRRGSEVCVDFSSGVIGCPSATWCEPIRCAEPSCECYADATRRTRCTEPGLDPTASCSCARTDEGELTLSCVIP